jgi:hypothetical protein
MSRSHKSHVIRVFLITIGQASSRSNELDLHELAIKLIRQLFGDVIKHVERKAKISEREIHFQRRFDTGTRRPNETWDEQMIVMLMIVVVVVVVVVMVMVVAAEGERVRRTNMHSKTICDGVGFLA